MRRDPTSRSSPVRLAGLCLAWALAALFPREAQAERVIFQDLRSLEVESVVQFGEQTLLMLPGGAELRVPAESVREIRASIPPAPDPVAVSEAAGGAWREMAGDLAMAVDEAAERHGVDPQLILAVAVVESRLDPRAISPKGAVGIMQLMPSTASLMAVVDPFDPGQNINGGTRWLRMMLDRFEGDLDLALAAYNAGPETVSRYGGIPPYPETRRYVRLVRDTLRRMSPTPLGA